MELKDFENWLLAHRDLKFYPCSSISCPIAEWLSSTHDNGGVSVGTSAASLYIDGEWRKAHLPEWAKRFIRLTDDRTEADLNTRITVETCLDILKKVRKEMGL